MTAAQRKTIEEWYAKCVIRVSEKILALEPWESYKNFCESKGIGERQTRHAKKNQQKLFLQNEKNHKILDKPGAGRWFLNLKLR